MASARYSTVRPTRAPPNGPNRASRWELKYLLPPTIPEAPSLTAPVLTNLLQDNWRLKALSEEQDMQIRRQGPLIYQQARHQTDLLDRIRTLEAQAVAEGRSYQQAKSARIPAPAASRGRAQSAAAHRIEPPHSAASTRPQTATAVSAPLRAVPAITERAPSGVAPGFGILHGENLKLRELVEKQQADLRKQSAEMEHQRQVESTLLERHRTLQAAAAAAAAAAAEEERERVAAQRAIYF